MNIKETEDVYPNFTFRCHACGRTVVVFDSQEQPHVCRIEL